MKVRSAVCKVVFLTVLAAEGVGEGGGLCVDANFQGKKVVNG